MSSYGARSYRADLRRIIQGDINPEGPGFKDEVILADLCGSRAARHQPIHPGSYVQVADEAGILDLAREFLSGRAGVSDAARRRQADCRQHWRGDCGTGHHAEGRAYLALGAERLELESPVPLREWTVLVASHDNSQRALHLASINAGREA